jgi:uncharacterized protein (UPF0128 family)
MIRKIGTATRLTPDVVRLDIPLRHEDDLPQLARRLEQLAFELKAIHQNESLNGNGKLADAYHTCRAFNRKLKQENPR